MANSTFVSDILEFRKFFSDFAQNYQPDSLPVKETSDEVKKFIKNPSRSTKNNLNCLVYLFLFDSPITKFLIKFFVQSLMRTGLTKSQVIDEVKATFQHDYEAVKRAKGQIGDFLVAFDFAKDSSTEPEIEVVGWARRRPNDGPFRFIAIDKSTHAARYIRFGKYDRANKIYDIAINSAETPNWSAQPLFDSVDQAMEFGQKLMFAHTKRNVFQYKLRITSQFNQLAFMTNWFAQGKYVLVNTSCGQAYIYTGSDKFVESKSNDPYLNNNMLLEWADDLEENELDALWYAKDNSDSINEDIEVHDELNPKLFDEDNKLKDEVRQKIEEIATEFSKQLAEDEVKIVIDDIILVGSNVSYNYTKDSDLDIHIIANTKDFSCPDDLYPKLYSAYRSLFNRKHNIEFYGIPVELYVETEGTALVSNGIYSVRKNEWIKEPKRESIPEVDPVEFDTELQKWIDRYEDITADLKTLLESKATDEIDSYINDIYDLRKKSISTEGEYGIGNLVFKEIRNLGYLDDLKELRIQALDQDLSIK